MIRNKRPSHCQIFTTSDRVESSLPLDENSSESPDCPSIHICDHYTRTLVITVTERLCIHGESRQFISRTVCCVYIFIISCVQVCEFFFIPDMMEVSQEAVPLKLTRIAKCAPIDIEFQDLTYSVRDGRQKGGKLKN